MRVLIYIYIQYIFMLGELFSIHTCLHSKFVEKQVQHTLTCFCSTPEASCLNICAYFDPHSCREVSPKHEFALSHSPHTAGISTLCLSRPSSSRHPLSHPAVT